MKRFKRILVFAGTDTPESAITRAAKLAVENNASLTLMDVVKPLPRALGMMTDIAKPAELEHLVAQVKRDLFLFRKRKFVVSPTERPSAPSLQQMYSRESTRAVHMKFRRQANNIPHSSYRFNR
ncbi:MAG: universal stress protein [Pirellulaceae bacterium]